MNVNAPGVPSAGTSTLDGWDDFDATTLVPKAPFQDVRTRNLTVTGTAVISSTTTSTGQFLGANGTKTAPSYSWTGDTDTGLYLAGANNPAMSAGDTLVESWTTSGAFVAASLALGFSGRSQFKSSADGKIEARAADGTTRLSQFDVGVGSAAAPAISCGSTAGATGLYGAASDQLGVALFNGDWYGFASDGFRARSNLLLGWSSSTTLGIGASFDTSLGRSAAGVVGVYGASTSVGSSVVVAQDKGVFFSSTTDPDGSKSSGLNGYGSNTLVLNRGATISGAGADQPGNLYLQILRTADQMNGFTTQYRQRSGASVITEICDHGGAFVWSWDQTATPSVPVCLGNTTGAAAPTARILFAEGSIAGTSNNVGGASLTIRSGNGTGTGTASQILFQTPTAVAGGTGAQTLTTRWTISAGISSLAATEALNILGTGTISGSGGSIDFAFSRLRLHDRGTLVAAFNATVVEFNTACLVGFTSEGIGHSASGVLGFYGASLSVGCSTVQASDKIHSWSSTTDPDGTIDLSLGRSAAGVLGVYGGTGTTTGSNIALASDKYRVWSSTTDPDGSADTSLYRAAAGLVGAGTGANTAGDFYAGKSLLTAGTMTATSTVQSLVRRSVSKFSWTNAMVTALGGVTAGDVLVCTLPAKTVVVNAYVVITGQAASVTTLTVAVGRVSATYIDYIVASDAKAAVNTVYGDASAERGTNLTGYDLPSITGTTAVNAHFISTGGNLSAVTASTGDIYLETITLP